MSLVSDTSAAIPGTPNGDNGIGPQKAPGPDPVLSPSPALSDLPLIVIRKRSAWSVFDLRDVWRYRDLLVALAERDIKLRYRQTALGAIWVILQPLLAAGVVTILFGRFGGLSAGKIPYFIFSFAGMMGWNVFMQTVSKSSGSLLGNSQLVAKVYFPRVILPFSTALSTVFDLGVAAVVLAIMMAICHVGTGIQVVLAPFFLLLLFMIAMGIGLFTGALQVTYRDVGSIQGIILQYGMWATPAGYSLAAAIAKGPKLYWFFELNPLSHLLDGLRWSIFGSGPSVAPPNALGLGYAIAVAVLVLFGGMLSFGSMQRKFADVI
jgi:lipopolysaccharide transport system permease protein